MSGPYLVIGIDDHWRIVSAWATKALALAELDRIRLSVMKPHDRKIAANPPTKWRFWEQASPPWNHGTKRLPVEFISTWKANSVGGIDGNPWSYLAVAELIVQGTVLDEIVEATS